MSMTALAACGAGFLLAVLWFDLMFDVQVLRHREAAPPDSVLSSIAGYYRRVTTEASPMNRLVALAMLATIVAVAIQVGRGDDPRWVGWASLGLIVLAAGLALVHTRPSAVRLGARTDPPEVQGRLARAILRDHLLCLAAIGCLIALQLSVA
jgi:hypothetical protein